MTVATRHALHSKVLDEARQLWVHLPDGYETSNERYAVLLLLDGPTHMLHTAGTAGFLAGNGRMPELIIVGIENTDRMRDMTTSADDGVPVPSQGGAGKFLEFLCDEVTPWVDAAYRTRPTRLLIGHSLGGLVALHALRTRPGFFAGLIAISPSMQWDDQDEADRIEEWLDTGPVVPCSLYMSAANENGLVGAAYRTAGLFDVKPPAGLRWKFDHMPEETHVSVPHRSTYDGFLYLFDGWKPHDLAQAVLDSGWPAVRDRVARARNRFGYEFQPSDFDLLDVVYWLANKNEVTRATQFVDEVGLRDRALPPQLAATFAFALLQQNKQDRDAERHAERGALSLIFHRIAVTQNPWHTSSLRALEAAGMEVAAATECDVSADQLQRYAGDYNAGRDTRTIRVSDGHLVTTADGETSQRLYAMKPDKFWTADGEGYEFRPSASGDGWEFVRTDRSQRIYRKSPSR